MNMEDWRGCNNDITTAQARITAAVKGANSQHVATISGAAIIAGAILVLARVLLNSAGIDR